MTTRLELHNTLCSIFGEDRVYFSPPSEHNMRYPCVRYKLSDMNTIYANNKPYLFVKTYTLTVMDADPNTKLLDQILNEIEYCVFDRFYTSDGLNHYVFTVKLNVKYERREER